MKPAMHTGSTPRTPGNPKLAGNHVAVGMITKGTRGSEMENLRPKPVCASTEWDVRAMGAWQRARGTGAAHTGRTGLVMGFLFPGLHPGLSHVALTGQDERHRPSPPRLPSPPSLATPYLPNSLSSALSSALAPFTAQCKLLVNTCTTPLSLTPGRASCTMGASIKPPGPGGLHPQAGREARAGLKCA